MTMEAVWKSVLTMSGVLCVMICGTQMKLKLSVDNLDSPPQVYLVCRQRYCSTVLFLSLLLLNFKNIVLFPQRRA